ncbi:uncharacterized protein BDZ99DRAFT_209142 [Mytilinidion resinicola]|uniref:Uncharacterized protein n=1 Tax=Mytilinidion resinicola TaxID=574789 RepID=A0A6A6XZZ6_9PEZI|nr:uncharacterized protein BDZ99DRAFT_209142 [Mytilinidion resinicola]KAF2802092.1 hypothetical protein BDZ99DRAFT_209142 [Mytilinidion resinicola]
MISVWQWITSAAMMFIGEQIFEKETRDCIEMAFRPRVAQGAQRIEWTCACGERLYEDFQGLSEEQLDGVQELVVYASGRQGARVYPSVNQVRAPAKDPTINISTNNSRQSNVQPRQSSSSAPQLAAVTQVQSAARGQIGRFLFLSLQVAPHHNDFAEVDVTHARQDHIFFQNTKMAYDRLRGNWLKRTLKAPYSISYTKFELFRHHRGYNAGHLAQEIPPELEVRAQRYHYDPCPLNPPLPSSVFLHALRHPEYYEGQRLQDRMPKKLHDGILGALGSAFSPIGWGVHIHDGPNKFAIAIFVSLTILASLVAAALWIALRKDVQGGTGIGQYAVAVLTAIFGLGVFGWSYE